MRGKMKVEVYKDNGGEYRWRMKASNGRIVAVSGEGFTRRSSCHESVVNVWTTLATSGDLDIVNVGDQDAAA